MSAADEAREALEAALTQALYDTETTGGWWGRSECEEFGRLVAPALLAAGVRPPTDPAAVAEVNSERQGPGWFWTQDEWAEWSNRLAMLIPEDDLVGDLDGSQESIIEETLAMYVRDRATTPIIPGVDPYNLAGGA